MLSLFVVFSVVVGVVVVVVDVVVVVTAVTVIYCTLSRFFSCRDAGSLDYCVVRFVWLFFFAMFFFGVAAPPLSAARAC